MSSATWSRERGVGGGTMGDSHNFPSRGLTTVVPCPLPKTRHVDLLVTPPKKILFAAVLLAFSAALSSRLVSQCFPKRVVNCSELLV